MRTAGKQYGRHYTTLSGLELLSPIGSSLAARIRRSIVKRLAGRLRTNDATCPWLLQFSTIFGQDGIVAPVAYVAAERFS